METVIIKLPEFEGPLELLAALTRRAEIEISTIHLKRLTEQIAAALRLDDIETGAESITHAGYLLWLKSRALLPKEKEMEAEGEESSDFQVALLAHLVEYCQFKQSAKALSAREERALESYPRLVAGHLNLIKPVEMPLGIEHLSLADLATLFEQVIQRTAGSQDAIEEEKWRISDKIDWLRKKIAVSRKLPIELIFSPELSKLELVVFFLAILEMMKGGEIQVVREKTGVMIIFHGERN